jgi:hypothetical protein
MQNKARKFSVPIVLVRVQSALNEKFLKTVVFESHKRGGIEIQYRKEKVDL